MKEAFNSIIIFICFFAFIIIGFMIVDNPVEYKEKVKCYDKLNNEIIGLECEKEIKKMNENFLNIVF